METGLASRRESVAAEKAATSGNEDAELGVCLVKPCQAPRSVLCSRRLCSGLLSHMATIHSAPLVAVLLIALSLPLLLSRLSPSRDQLPLSSQMFLMISSFLAFIPDHKQHLEQLTPCAPNILWFTRQLVTRATTALFFFQCID